MTFWVENTSSGLGKVSFFSLRNFKLHVDQIQMLDLNAPEYASAMANTLAIMHWHTKFDANDIEFALGSSPADRNAVHRSIPVTNIQHLSKGTSTYERITNAGPNFKKRSINLWAFDFDACKPIDMNESGVKQAIKAFVENAPYYPRPFTKVCSCYHESRNPSTAKSFGISQHPYHSYQTHTPVIVFDYEPRIPGTTGSSGISQQPWDRYQTYASIIDCFYRGRRPGTARSFRISRQPWNNYWTRISIISPERCPETELEVKWIIAAKLQSPMQSTEEHPTLIPLANSTMTSPFPPSTPSTTAPITFYDIALAPPAPKTACSPNPWKTRYALNFKNIPYKTAWVPLLDIPSVRGALNIPASRKFADGSPYPTLPIISDPATGRILGDSFEIATYLQEQYPSAGAGDLFPVQELDYVFGRELNLHAPPIAVAETAGDDDNAAAYVKFNTNVDAAFTAHTQLMMEGFPFDPAVAEECKEMFSRRIGMPWDDLAVSAEKRGELLRSFEEALGGLAGLYERDVSGPFLRGSRPSYADFIVGGWLRFSWGMLPREEWEALKGWHGGVFGRLHEALKVFARMD
ncbi:hypothetical protein FQN50_006641 [Emmonsiellopsis sp. PD_5]|nr:hypothetical protein FQN50_006641 [Emmonsiellopsis sp. PD_5]